MTSTNHLHPPKQRCPHCGWEHFSTVCTICKTSIPAFKKEPVMSLETVITENTAAVRALIEALTTAGMTKQAAVGTVVHAAVGQAHTETTKQDASAKKSGQEAQASAETVSSPNGAAPQTTGQQASAPADESKALTYDDIKTPFLQLIKDKGRDAAANLLKPFGAAKLPDVKPEQFADVLKAIQEASKEEALA